MSFSPSVAAAAVTSGLVLVAVLAIAFAIAGAAHRRSRRGSRERAGALAATIRDALDARISRAELRADDDGTDENAFWSALEIVSTGLSRLERRRLTGLLGPNPHVAAELRALAGDSPGQRERAARRLALVSSPASRRALRSALARGPESVALVAATALARARDARALRWILAHPASLASRTPRAWTGLLVGFGRGAASELLACLAGGSEDARLERALVETLGLFGCREAAPAVAARLHHRALEVRVAAARALGMIGGPEHGEPLIEALEDGAWQVRAQSARALGLLQPPSAVLPLSGRLIDRSWWVRRHAAYALRGLGPEGHAALRRAIEGSPDPYARDIAEEALAGGWPAVAAASRSSPRTRERATGTSRGSPRLID